MAILSSTFLSVPCANHSNLSTAELLCSCLVFRHRLFVGEPSAGRRICRRRSTRGFVVSSMHSNSRILKVKRKSRFGQSLSPYDCSDGELDDEEDEEKEQEDDGGDWLDDDGDEFAEPAEYGSGQNRHMRKKMIKTRDKSKGMKGWRSNSEDFDRNSHGGRDLLHVKNEQKYSLRSHGGLSSAGRGKAKNKESEKQRYPRLSEDIELDERIGQIIAACPSLFSYSVEKSLNPTVRYLVEEVGIKEKDLELGAPRNDVVKMVTKHPQLLHYSIDEGLLPRINFLRSIGMRNSDILKVLTSLTQVLSLSLEENLKPKYMYLVKELRNEVHSLTKYPTYLSLSLEQRIRPRHRFLVSLKKAPKGPFPLSSFVPTDECFCRKWAGTSLDKYLTFRQRLL